MRKGPPLSCGLRRSNGSSVNAARVWPHSGLDDQARNTVGWRAAKKNGARSTDGLAARPALRVLRGSAIFSFGHGTKKQSARDWSNGRSFVSFLRCSACVSNKPVSIVVARRSRHNRPASRSANSRSTAVGFEVLIIFGILQSTDHCLGSETMAPRIAAGAALAFFRSRPGALRGIAPVGGDLPERGHRGAT